MPGLENRTAFITGGTRGIGLAIARRLGSDGANVVIAAKTDQPPPKLPGTVHTAAAEVEAAGGNGLGVVCDIRSEEQVQAAVDTAVEAFGGIDIVINNASAIQLTGTAATDMKRYDLMNSVNGRGTFVTTKTCLPHLMQSDNPHILALAPPLDMRSQWFGPNVAYAIAKYTMSMCILGWAEEFRSVPIAANALWPRTTIATAAIEYVVGEELMRASRTPEIMADAAHAIVTKPAAECTGNFFIDDVLLMEEGVTDFRKYKVDPDAELALDGFLPADLPPMP